MPDEIAIPDDHRMAVKMLPLSQKPYDDVTLERKAQSVMFHYDVPKEAMKKFLGAVGDNLVSVRMADPDTSDGRSLFEKATKDFGVGAVHKLKMAIRRLAKDEPFAAIFKRPPSPNKKDKDAKKTKSSRSDGGASAAASSTESSAASADAAKEKADEYECISDAELDDDRAGEDDDDDDDDDDDKKRTTGGVRCLNQLFNRVSNDVSFVCYIDGLMCVALLLFLARCSGC